MKDNLPNIQINEPEETELTLRDIIAKMREYGAEFRRSWRILAITCLPFLIWQGYMWYTTKPTYQTKLTFMVDEDNGTGGGFLSSLLGGIGLSDGGDNNDKILELARSMRIIRQALFQKAEIDGKTDFLANHFIRLQNLHEEDWSKKPKNPGQASLKGFLFTRDSVERFTRLENAAFKSLYGMLTGSEEYRPLFSARDNADSGVMTLSLTTRSEALTIALLRAIFEQLSDFYINASTEKQQETYEIIRAKSDSLRRLLTGTEFRAAQFKEENNLLLRPTDQLPSERLSRDKAMLTLMYGEAVKNLELADFALRNKVPYIQAIDLPIPPLVGTPYGKKQALGLGLGLGLVLGSLFVIGRKMVRDQMTPPVAV
ncbi:MAG TPA: hypothetical protein PK228_17445 [Saprospiraceae bacterium]|nr:hypothetical protein [Saprospiraceae bacterium]